MLCLYGAFTCPCPLELCTAGPVLQLEKPAVGQASNLVVWGAAHRPQPFLLALSDPLDVPVTKTSSMSPKTRFSLTPGLVPHQKAFSPLPG